MPFWKMFLRGVNETCVGIGHFVLGSLWQLHAVLFKRIKILLDSYALGYIALLKMISLPCKAQQ